MDLSLKNMVYKIVLWLLLLTGNVAIAQESNSVLYERAQYIHTPQNKNKKSKIMAIPVVINRKAQLIYSSGHLLFKSDQGIDTVSLSGVNKTYWNYPYKKMFCVFYNNYSDFITLLFCNKKEAKEFRSFMLKNGHYEKGFFKLTFFALMPFVFFFPSLPPSWSDWQQKCD